MKHQKDFSVFERVHYSRTVGSVVVLIATLFFVALRMHSAFAAIGAPTVAKQGYGLGARLQQGSDSFPGSWNKVHFDFTFMYEGGTSDLKAFRLYEKKPGDYGFTRLVEFSSLLDVTSSHSGISGNWSISRLNTTWIISKRDASLLTFEPVALYEPTSSYLQGTHSYYVTAVDSLGNESAPSQTYNLNVLGTIAVLSPRTDTPAALLPNLKWSVVSGWPDNQVLYIIKMYDGKSTVWSKTQINKTGELTYDGAPLNPAKKYTLNIQGQWTSYYLKPLNTYFAATSPDLVFQVSSAPPPPPPTPTLSPTPTPTPTLSATPSPKSTPPPSAGANITPSPIPSKPVLLPSPTKTAPTPQPSVTTEPEVTPGAVDNDVPEAPKPRESRGFFRRIGLAISRFFEDLFGF